jgi:hypothetical protein
MSYELVTEDGSQGQFASNNGYADLIAAANGKFTSILFDQGRIDGKAEVEQCIEELRAIRQPADVVTTAKALIGMMEGHTEILITDGVTGNNIVGKLAKAAYKLKIRPDSESPAKAQARRQLFEVISSNFDEVESQVRDDVVSAYIEKKSLDVLLDAIDLSQMDDMVRQIPAILGELGRQEAMRAWRELTDNVQVTVDETRIVDLLNTDAIEYAEDRAAEMVGKKWVNGQLIDNPDAKWAITEGTRDMLRDHITQAYQDGLTPAQLKVVLENNYEFSEARAKMIARTETAMASMNGALNSWKRSGVVEATESLLSDDHDHDDECDDNADAGPIPLGEEYPSGDESAPYHPNCNCTNVAVLISETEGEE